MHHYETFATDHRRRIDTARHDIPWQDLVAEPRRERVSLAHRVSAATSHLARPLRGTGVRLVRLAERLED